MRSLNGHEGARTIARSRLTPLDHRHAVEEHRSTSELLRDATRHGQAVLRGEVRLAIAEAKDEVRQGLRRTAWGAGAAVAVLIAALLVLTSGIVALAQIVPAALAILAGALVCGVAGWIMLRAASGS